MARTGYVYDPRYLLHDPGKHHPERPDRLRVIQRRLVFSHLLEELVLLTPTPAPWEWLTRVHDPDYLQRFAAACQQKLPFLDTPDCGICPESFEVARLAVGGVFAAVDALAAGKIDNAFCAIRPPGHHAERHRAGGFCFFNNIVLGARYLQEKYGFQRLAIVDWDAHHGNGTQQLLEMDDTVFYISLHQDPSTSYPGTGRRSDCGRGRGQGYTLNLPLLPFSSDQDYLEAMEDFVLPALEKFRPEVLLISAGFDAHRDDPLTRLRLTRKGYMILGALLGSFAKDFCAGRLISVLEGGYNLEVLEDCVYDHLLMLRSL